MKRFDTSVPQAPFREASRETPDQGRNAVIPFAVALLSGLVTLLAGALIVAGMQWPFRWVAVGAGAVMLLTMLWWLRRLDESDLLWTVERIIGLDIDHDGQVGQPQDSTWLTVEVRHQDESSIHYYRFPVTREQLAVLCKGLTDGRPFSEREWTGAGQPFSPSQFRELRAILLERGLLVWRDERYPQQGVTFTAYGWRVIRSCVRACACEGDTDLRLPPGQGRGLLTAGEE